MWAVRSSAAEFAIVVAVVAVSAKDARADQPRGGGAVQVEHIGQEAGLGKGTVAIVNNRVAGSRVEAELLDQIERIAREYQAIGQVPVFDQHLFSHASAMASQAVFKLVDRRGQHGCAVH